MKILTLRAGHSVWSPELKKLLSAEGLTVEEPLTPYWIRRIHDGDVDLVDVKDEQSTEETKNLPTKKTKNKNPSENK